MAISQLSGGSGKKSLTMFPEPRKKWFFWRGNFHHFQNKEVFEAEFPVYIIALKASGYNNELQYTEKTVAKKRFRRRNVIWFNPPWNDEVSTYVAKKFLSMIDRHFPKASTLTEAL